MLGGVNVFIRPLIGAAIYYGIKDAVSAYSGHWMLIVGLITIVVILVLRRGVLGYFKQLRF